MNILSNRSEEEVGDMLGISFLAKLTGFHNEEKTLPFHEFIVWILFKLYVILNQKSRNMSAGRLDNNIKTGLCAL